MQLRSHFQWLWFFFFCQSSPLQLPWSEHRPRSESFLWNLVTLLDSPTRNVDLSKRILGWNYFPILCSVVLPLRDQVLMGDQKRQQLFHSLQDWSSDWIFFFIIAYSASGVLDSSQNILSPAGRSRRQLTISARRKSRQQNRHAINRYTNTFLQFCCPYSVL